MAPFSVCSKCNVKTRKVVKDPITLKMIYLCPLCFKAGNVQQKKPSAKIACVKKVFEKVELSKDTQSKTELESHPRRETFEHAKVGKPKTEDLPSRENQSGPCGFKPPLPSNQKRAKLITPPIMQTVIINGRKYVAISETADD